MKRTPAMKKAFPVNKTLAMKRTTAMKKGLAIMKAVETKLATFGAFQTRTLITLMATRF